MKTVVVKLGTSTLTQEKSRLSRRHMLEYARQVALLQEKGHRFVIVTSGAFAAGREVFTHAKVGRSLPSKQMFTAVGQGRLMHLWGELFGLFDIAVGQMLLTRNDFVHREQYLNVRDTLFALFEHQIIPIVNENDTVAVKETKFGDNDNLSALIANLIAADLLVILTDQEGLFSADPRYKPDAKLISEVERVDAALFDAIGKATSSPLGTGGMVTKVEAARLATESGTQTVIASGTFPDILERLLAGEKVGTTFLPQTTPKESRKRWLLSEKVQGAIAIDAGAALHLRRRGASLLPVGVEGVEGSFVRGAVVQILSETVPIAIGIASYGSDEISSLAGAQSSKIEELLGYSYGPAIIHRDDLVLLSERAL